MSTVITTPVNSAGDAKSNWDEQLALFNEGANIKWDDKPNNEAKSGDYFVAGFNKNSGNPNPYVEIYKVLYTLSPEHRMPSWGRNIGQGNRKVLVLSKNFLHMEVDEFIGITGYKTIFFRGTQYMNKDTAKKFINHIEQVREEAALTIFDDLNDEGPDDLNDEGPDDLNDEGSTTAYANVQIRKRQQEFRKAVCLRCNNKCVLTGESEPKLLQACHIKPWCKSSDRERIDGNNGILLTPNLHTLFDQHYFTFTLEGLVLINPLWVNDIERLHRLGLDSNSRITISTGQIEYLSFRNAMLCWVPK